MSAANSPNEGKRPGGRGTTAPPMSQVGKTSSEVMSKLIEVNWSTRSAGPRRYHLAHSAAWLASARCGTPPPLGRPGQAGAENTKGGPPPQALPVGAAGVLGGDPLPFGVEEEEIGDAARHR